MNSKMSTNRYEIVGRRVSTINRLEISGRRVSTTTVRKLRPEDTAATPVQTGKPTIGLEKKNYDGDRRRSSHLQVPEKKFQSTSTRIGIQKGQTSKAATTVSQKKKTSSKIEVEKYPPSAIKIKIDRPKSSTPKTNKKGNKALELFAERVSICGLEEAYKAKTKVEKIMFRGSLLIALSMIIYESYAIACQYRDLSTILAIETEVTSPAPFPNITICFPMSWNEEARKMFILPKKVLKPMIENNLTESDLLNYFQDMVQMNVKANDLSKPIYILTNRAIKAGWEEMMKRNQSFRDVVMPCSAILSNCAFNGHPFDCCVGAKFATIWTTSCYELRTDNLLNIGDKTQEATDPMKLEAFGLTVDVSTEWTHGVYQEGSASDGYLVFPHIPTRFSVPTPVPTGMEAVINLAQPRKLEDLEHCRPMHNIPQLKYFDYYDEQGSNCVFEMGVDIILERLGCRMAALSYVPPENEVCSFEQGFLVSTLISDGGVEFLEKTFGKEDMFGKDSLKGKLDAMGYLAKLSNSDNSPCLPLCSRWTYPVLSASYGSITYSDKKEEERQLANRSWSRIRVLSSYSSFWSHTEQTRAKSYLALCEIGGMMGVYAGFSMITIAEIVAYGANILQSLRKNKKKKKKIHPAR